MVDSEAKDNSEDLLEEVATAGSEEDTQQPDTIESLQQQLDEAHDRVLRAQAELLTWLCKTAAR